jgi:hypothetical protein
MAYRMSLIGTVKDIGEVRIGQKSNNDFNIELGEEEFNIPWQVAEDIAKYILQRS